METVGLKVKKSYKNFVPVYSNNMHIRTDIRTDMRNFSSPVSSVFSKKILDFLPVLFQLEL